MTPWWSLGLRACEASRILCMLFLHGVQLVAKPAFDRQEAPCPGNTGFREPLVLRFHLFNDRIKLKKCVGMVEVSEEEVIFCEQRREIRIRHIELRVGDVEASNEVFVRPVWGEQGIDVELSVWSGRTTAWQDCFRVCFFRQLLRCIGHADGIAVRCRWGGCALLRFECCVDGIDGNCWQRSMDARWGECQRSTDARDWGLSLA